MMNWKNKPAEFLLDNGHVDRTKEITQLVQDTQHTVLKVISIGDTSYVAVKDEVTKSITASIWKIAIQGNQFSYAMQDETENPKERACPLSILKILTPTTNEGAKSWRTHCYVSYKESKKKKALNKLPLGAKIQFVNDRNSITLGDHKIHMGDVIQLIKKRIGAKKEWGWFTGKVRWNLSIPNDFEVIK